MKIIDFSCMKRLFFILVLFLVGLVSYGQGASVVVDPTQIAASASDAATALETSLSLLEQLGMAKEKIDSMRNSISDFFDEDGVGGRFIDTMQDVGRLQRLIEDLNQTIEMAVSYNQSLSELENWGVEVPVHELRFAVLIQEELNASFEILKSLLGSPGSRKSKKDATDEFERRIKEVKAEIAIKQLEHARSLQIANTVREVDAFLDMALSTDSFVEHYRDLGTVQKSSNKLFSILTLLLGFVGICATVWGFILSFRGDEAGTSERSTWFIRVGVAMCVGGILIGILGSL